MTKDFVSSALREGLEKKPCRIARICLFIVSVAVFFVFARYARYAMIDEFSGYRVAELQIFTAIVYTVIFALAYAVQLRVGRNLPTYAHILLALITGVILLGKISLLDYVSDDYSIFLSNWIYSYTQMTVKEGLGTFIQSDYSPPYLYFLVLISRIKDFPWQYLVKALSIAFELLMAYALMKIASLKLKGEGGQLLVFHTALILPTVMFNGAYWAQCDMVYSSFCLMAVYMGLRRRSALSMIFFGLGLSFKLQAVFFMPVMLPLWLRKDIKLRHLVLIPSTYMLMMIPALWGGKSFYHVRTVYFQQANNYKTLTMNGPNVYQLLPDLDGGMLYNMFGMTAIVMGFAIVMAMCAIVCVYRDRLTADSTVLTCLFMLGGIPLLLPRMHERYMFGADVLALVAAVYCPRRIYLPLCFGFASYIAYTAGLPGEKLMDLKWSGFLMMAAVALTGVELWRSLTEKTDPAMAEVKA